MANYNVPHPYMRQRADFEPVLMDMMEVVTRSANGDVDRTLVTTLDLNLKPTRPYFGITLVAEAGGVGLEGSTVAQFFDGLSDYLEGDEKSPYTRLVVYKPNPGMTKRCTLTVTTKR